MVFGSYREEFRRTSVDAEHQDEDADDAATDEQCSLYHIHPDNGFHAAEQRKNDDGYAQDEHDGVDVDVEEGCQCHAHQEEYGACL